MQSYPTDSLNKNQIILEGAYRVTPFFIEQEGKFNRQFLLGVIDASLKKFKGDHQEFVIRDIMGGFLDHQA